MTDPAHNTADLVDALRSGQQMDEEGVRVSVSRQACEEAADLITAQAAENARLTEQCDRAIDLTGKAQDRMNDMSDRAEKADAERGVALARVQVLEDALHFYADFHENPNDGPWGVGSTDFGAIALASLKGGAVCTTPDPINAPIMTKTHWKILAECYPCTLQGGGTAGEVWSDLLRLGYVAVDPWGITEKGIAALKGGGE
jgi:hypothetical protein